MPLTPCVLMVFKIVLTAAVLIRVMQIHTLSDSEKQRKTGFRAKQSVVAGNVFRTTSVWVMHKLCDSSYSDSWTVCQGRQVSLSPLTYSTLSFINRLLWPLSFGPLVLFTFLVWVVFFEFLFFIILIFFVRKERCMAEEATGICGHKCFSLGNAWFFSNLVIHHMNRLRDKHQSRHRSLLLQQSI